MFSATPNLNPHSRKTLNMNLADPFDARRKSGMIISTARSVFNNNLFSDVSRASVEFRNNVKRRPKDRRNMSVIVTPSRNGQKLPEFSIAHNETPFQTNQLDNMSMVQGLPGLPSDPVKKFTFARE